MKLFYKTLCACLLISFCIDCAGDNKQTAGQRLKLEPFPIVETGDNVIVPPEGVHPFYKKYINADGVIIVSSDKVPDAALITSRKTILYVVSKCPDFHKAMMQHHPRISIMASSETASDLPDYGPRSDGQWGLGQGPGGSTSLVSEKGISYEGNTDYIANFLLHEFTHMIHNMGIHFAAPEVEDEIYAAYINAVEKGLFIAPKNKPRENITAFREYRDDEYFTHMVNAWFDLNESLPGPWMDFKIGEWGPKSGTKEALKQSDPIIYEIISRYFPESGGDIIRPFSRSEE